MKVKNLKETLSEKEFKELLKEAFIEALENKRHFISEIIYEAIEDIAFGKAIEEGERTKIVDKSIIFHILKKITWRQSSIKVSQKI